MAQIGNLGPITFEVSSNKVLTFQSLTQTVKGRWTSHAVIGGKPQSEFLGADLRSASVSIYISASFGVKPRDVINSIENAIENGTPFTFVIGGRKIGKYQWVITDMSEAYGVVIKNGALVSANLTLTLSEYN